MPNSGDPFASFYAESSRNGLTKPKAIRGQGTKMINMGEIFAHGRINSIEMDRVPLTDKEKINCLLQNGDLLFARQSLVLSGAGKCSIFLGDDEPVTFESHIIRVRLDPSKANHIFYYYYFLSPIGRSAIESIVEQGAGVAGIRGSDLGSLYVDCLPLKEQQCIASLLTALDDKINLNRQMNETLEAIARLFFKDWFVDFGPTRAKAEGRPPYLAPELWSLFPDALDDDDKPVGWIERRVEDVLELAYGKALKASDRTTGSIPVYGSGGITGYHNEHLVDGPSVIVGRKGTVGSLYWEDRPFFPIDTVFYVKPKAPLSFCYYLLKTLGLEGMNTDAAVPGLNRNNVYRLLVMWSCEELREAFDAIVTPLRSQIFSNTEESRTLTQTRDLLLPKLMSGEIRLREAEKIVEKVA